MYRNLIVISEASNLENHTLYLPTPQAESGDSRSHPLMELMNKKSR